MKNKKYLSQPNADFWFQWYTFRIKETDSQIMGLVVRKVQLVGERNELASLTIKARKHYENS